jgi:hypothetical protein
MGFRSIKISHSRNGDRAVLPSLWDFSFLADLSPSLERLGYYRFVALRLGGFVPLR